MAYIDPGAGSMALQFIIAGFFGLIFTVRRKLWAGFRLLFGPKPNDRS